MKYMSFLIIIVFLVSCNEKSNEKHHYDPIINYRELYDLNYIYHVQSNQIVKPYNFNSNIAFQICKTGIINNRLREICKNATFSKKYYYERFLFDSIYFLKIVSDKILDKYGLYFYNLTYGGHFYHSLVIDKDCNIYLMKGFECNSFDILLNTKLGSINTIEKRIDSANLYNILIGPRGKIKPYDTIKYIY